MEDGHDLGALPKSPQEILRRLEQASPDQKDELQLLNRIWAMHDRDPSVWRIRPEPYRVLARRFFDLGSVLDAIAVAKTAVDSAPGQPPARFPRDLLLHQTLALALAHTGAVHAAQKIAGVLFQRGHKDAETLGILARTYKDLSSTAEDPADAKQAMEESLKYYRLSYELHGGIWSGINVATLSCLLGNDAVASQIAGDVKTEIGISDPDQLPLTPQDNRYWSLCVLGEADVILGNYSSAESWYRRARSEVGNKYRHLVSARQQLRRLLQFKIDREKLESTAIQWVDHWLPTATSAIFVGHMIDQPYRNPPRFPDRKSGAVKEAIRQWIKENNVQIGYASAACGSDTLFHQCLQETNGRSIVVLPYAVSRFRQRSVDFAGPDWQTRFDQVLAGSTRVLTVSEHRIRFQGIGYEYANLVVEGLAMAAADQFDTRLLALAVFDGNEPDGAGGTFSTVNRWRQQGIAVDVIDPTESTLTIKSLAPTGDQRPEIRNQDSDIAIRAILFGDAVGFSRFSEEQVLTFVSHCIKPIAQMLNDKYGDTLIHRRTTGDGFYLVFKDVRSAGSAALDINGFLEQRASDKGWTDCGLPEDLTFRLALHAGPVQRCEEPLTDAVEYTGTHVSRAARLEPRTPPGQVYASEAFAAIWRQQRIKAFRCIYVKQLQWDKRYGTFPTFFVTRR